MWTSSRFSAPTQWLDSRVQGKIRELVASGVTDVLIVKQKLLQFVEHELFASQAKPRKHMRSFYPTVIDIENYIHAAAEAIHFNTLVPVFSPQDEYMVAIPCPPHFPWHPTWATKTQQKKLSLKGRAFAVTSVLRRDGRDWCQPMKSRTWSTQCTRTQLRLGACLALRHQAHCLRTSKCPLHISPPYANPSAFHFATLDVAGADSHQLRDGDSANIRTWRRQSLQLQPRRLRSVSKTAGWEFRQWRACPTQTSTRCIVVRTKSNSFVWPLTFYVCEVWARQTKSHNIHEIKASPLICAHCLSAPGWAWAVELERQSPLKFFDHLDKQVRSIAKKSKKSNLHARIVLKSPQAYHTRFCHTSTKSHKS